MGICRREDMPLYAPNSPGNVWPKQVCPAYEPRDNTLNGLRQSWYCCFADFRFDTPKALDVGVCYWAKQFVGGGR